MIKRRQFGQSMTEYVIIVALLAVAGMAIYGLFGDTVRGQLSDTTAEPGRVGSVGVGATPPAAPDPRQEGSNFSDDIRQ